MTRDNTYPAWSAANGGRLSWFDDAAGAMHESRAPEDLVLALARILWPTFVEMDGLIFLADAYSTGRVEQLRSQGFEGERLEHWMNLFCIDGLVPTRCEDLAQPLLDTWRTKLAADHPTRTFDVKFLGVEEVGDVCITFHQTATR